MIIIMKGTLYSYQSAMKTISACDSPKLLGHIHDSYNRTKTCLFDGHSVCASVIRLNAKEMFLNSYQYHSSLFYVIKGNGTINENKYETGDVFCIHKNAYINSDTESVLFNVDDSPLMKYFNMKSLTTEVTSDLCFKHENIMNGIEGVEERIKHSGEILNRLGVVMGTDDRKSISKTLWCLMTKTKPFQCQPVHKHNSVAIDYCVSGEGYTLLSKTLDANGNLENPVRVNWSTGTFFLTPPGWLHSHYSTCDSDSFLFPVQDAGLYMHLNTLGFDDQKL